MTKFSKRYIYFSTLRAHHVTLSVVVDVWLLFHYTSTAQPLMFQQRPILPEYAVKGLVVDQKLGNILKLDENKNVVVSIMRSVPYCAIAHSLPYMSRLWQLDTDSLL